MSAFNGQTVLRRYILTAPVRQRDEPLFFVDEWKKTSISR